MRCLLQLREGAEDVEKNGAVPGIGSSYSGFSAVFLAPPCLCLRFFFILLIMFIFVSSCN